jgi:hypothetical protein
VGDSKNTIRYFVTRSSPKYVGLKVLVERIDTSLINLNVQFFHLYFQNNIDEDAMVNRAIGLALGLLGVYIVECFVTPL